MDPGTGLSENSVKAALRSLEAQNMIVHTADNSDGGRPKHCYALAMQEEAEDCDDSPEIDTQGSNFDTLPSDFDTRTEKETKRKKPTTTPSVLAAVSPSV